jgi:hypothetical protein
LIECIKINFHLLDYYEDKGFYELFQVFIILNEEENLEEQIDQRVMSKQHGIDKYLYEIDIDNIKKYSDLIKDNPKYSYPIELESKKTLQLYYRFLNHIERNINSLKNYKRKVGENDE